MQTYRVERSDGHGLHSPLVSELFGKACAHLIRRPVGKGDGGDPGGGHAALFNQIGDAAHKRSCFAGSGTGDHRDGGIGGGNRFPLFRIQSEKCVRGSGLCCACALVC